MIDFDKPLTTRDGDEVIIYVKHKDDEGGEYPIHGAYKDGAGVWEMVTWTKEGKFFKKDRSDNDLDLINMKEELSISGFVNIYINQQKGEYIHYIYPTRESADRNSVGSSRIACIPILFKGKSGDGL